MARILDNKFGRRNILLTTDDVLMIVREYQRASYGVHSYKKLRQRLNNSKFFLPEEIV